MSWFDKLFGEDNDSTEDYLSKRNQRRQKAKPQEQDSLLPQNNDVYERPKGKFRFPMRILEEANEAQHLEEDSISKDNSNHSDQQHSDRHTSDSINANHKQRRRRHMYDKTASNDVNTQTENQESPKETYSEPKRESKSHKGQRMRIQTDVLRANASKKTKRDTSMYHESDFKASEVPSAIFGTQKPHPLENGVIKPSDETENGNSEQVSNYEDNKTQSQTPAQESSEIHDTKIYNDQFVDPSIDAADDENPLVDNKQPYSIEDNDYIEAQAEEDNEQPQQPSEQKQQSSNEQPKVNNTINIENIYASQIVEEIRRERERKVLQKRQFKKALQQKRQENQDNNEDSIQKAIDEMYAKQAHHFIGESSLDEESKAKNVSENQTEVSIQDAQLSDDSRQNEDDTRIGATSPFNYEEIDLDNVRDVHKINDVNVDADLESESPDSDSDIENHTSAEHKSLNDDVETTISNDDTLNTVEDNNENISDEDLYIEVEDNDHISDAQYREVTMPQNESPEVESIIPDSETEREFEDQESATETELNSAQDMTQPSESEMSSESLSNEIAEVQQGSTQYNTEQSDTDQVEIEDEVASKETQLHSSSTQSNALNNEVTESNELTSNRNQTSIRKGNKPFNVVMIPSDKKRMMDAKKLKNSNQHFTNSSNTSQSSQNESKEIESNDLGTKSVVKAETVGQEQPQQNLTSTSETTEHPSNSIDASNYSEQPINHGTSEKHDDEMNPSSVDGNQYVSHDETKFNKNNNEHVSQITQNQEPKLKPDKVHNQLDSSKTTDDSGKPTIRRGPNIKLPNLDLLEEPKQHEIDNVWIEDKKQELNDAFYYFNVPAEVQNVTEGPSVTRFELSVEKGVKVSRITALQDDIKMALAAKDIRIEAPIPGTSLVGIEVPNQNAATVNLRSIIEDPTFKNAESKLTVAMGLRINNEPLLMDISKTPHALIAGATGSGKSVCINSILMSLLYKNHPEELKLLLIDPKMVELAPYNDLPHLVAPVITDVKAATQSLKWAVEEMERRYKVFAKYHVRNITAFNKKATYEDRMPKIVIVIDELADLMMMAPQEVEQSIARIAQKARACGIHMLVATQRPSVNVITGLIKANIPTRIAFMVSSSVDSRTILDSGGAERLLGYGDMLYLGSGMNKPIRVQGTFVSDDEIDDVVDFIKQQRDPEYLFEEKELLKKTEAQPQDSLFDDVCRFMLKEGHISTSLVQRHFQIGYNRAARIVDQLEQLGYVSGANGSKPRDVYITELDLNEN
ncbi:DNA translocase FtsK [Staphylococcus equorum]|uniref:DNA translocase FtsK n=1 Tax=Staphylococcus equorum TaxID=246432 RepID=UPI0008060BC4|nr:DNA translocase FtsK [Staphylococcus equorum]ANQ64557.1 cell division protein FtsK [Staphylococcus equorum]